MNATEANRALKEGGRAAAALEPQLVKKYETLLRASASKIAARYKRLSTPTLAAAGELRTTPTLYEIVQPDDLAQSVKDRTRTTQRRMAAAAGDPFSPNVTRAFYEPLVTAQAGRQAERVVAGSQDVAAQVILNALSEGWTVDQTAAALKDTLGLQADWQAWMLARTDLVSIGNAASHQAAASLGDSGPQYKRWTTAGDNRVRPTHVAADGQVVGIGDPYEVGDGELMYPGDPDGPDEEVINCRCVSVFADAADVQIAHTDEGGITYGGQQEALAASGVTLRHMNTQRKEILRQLISSINLTAAGQPSAEERRQMAKSGVAMPDGSYYIRNGADLDNAIHAVGRGGASHNAIRRHIIRRAKALGLSSRIPDTWGADGSIAAAGFLPADGTEVELVADVGDPSPVDELLASTLEELMEACTMLAYANDEVIDELEDASQVADAVGNEDLASTLRDRMAYHQSVQDQVMAWLGPSAPPLDIEPDDDAENADVGQSMYAAGPTGALPYPRDWFFAPEADRPTPLTVTADGQVFGHLAEWSRCHSGYLNSCVMAPRSPSDYAFFHVGQVYTEEGPVDIGKITVNTGHAAPHLTAAAAREHYDHTGSVAAYVRVVDGKLGPWLAGSIEPTATDRQIRDLRANGPSGDWRNPTRRPGGLDLLGILSVPKQGFTTPRALVASGEDGEEVVMSLIAAADIDCGCDEPQSVQAIVEAVLDPQEVRLASRRAA
jgi:hypothetical protein